MPLLTGFDWIEATGWIASALAVMTYAMSTMLTLRIIAIVSSLIFLVYAVSLQAWPLVAMELVLLPINGYRLWQIVALRGQVRQAAQTDVADFSIVRRYGKARRVSAGEVIFQRGDPVDRLYYVASGEVMIEEVGAVIRSGDIFGEVAFFTDAGVRTATARCVTDAVIHELDEKRFLRLQFEDPRFGLAVMRTVTRRLVGNWNPG
ncbi:MAG: cyclic nucleotide-binding domain-containing protein [Rhodobacterales bacterium]|nr:cyclic nucleotide-binding domain-containing protein [Rhodobacterales bacterium]